MNNYDAVGRPLDLVRNFLVLEGGAWQWKSYGLSRSYDLAGNVTAQTYPSGRTVNYGYDAAGRLGSFTGNLGGIAGVTRDRLQLRFGLRAANLGLARSPSLPPTAVAVCVWPEFRHEWDWAAGADLLSGRRGQRGQSLPDSRTTTATCWADELVP